MPAINLFPDTSTAWWSEGVSQFHLLADRTRPQDFELHSVTKSHRLSCRDAGRE